MCRSTAPVPKILYSQKVRQGCSLGTIKGSVAAEWEFLDCNFQCMSQVLYWILLLLILKKLLLLIKIIFYKLLTCSALISVLFSLGMLEHFILGKVGMGGILPSVKS